MKTIIHRPVITEKSLTMASTGWYTFAAACEAGKNEIKKEIEFLYGVNVTAVRSMHEHGKTRRVGKSMRTIRKPDWKKAMVQLKKGQRIDAFDVVPKEEQSTVAGPKTENKKKEVEKK